MGLHVRVNSVTSTGPPGYPDVLCPVCQGDDSSWKIRYLQAGKKKKKEKAGTKGSYFE